jgi:hypothetical protein
VAPVEVFQSKRFRDVEPLHSGVTVRRKLPGGQTGGVPDWKLDGVEPAELLART